MLKRFFITFGIVLVFFACILVYNACNPGSSKTSGVDLNNLDTLNYKVSEATDWTNLFKRSHGWFGGDGIFSIPYNGVDVYQQKENDTVAFVFSDSMIGDIENDSLQPGSSMVHNSIALLKGRDPKPENISFEYIKNTNAKPGTLFTPTIPAAQKGDIYWLGDGFMNPELDSSIFVFGYVIHNSTDNDWGFSETANVLLQIPKGSQPPFQDYKQIPTPFFFKGDSDTSANQGSFGAGIFVNTKEAGAKDPDGYVYVYGVRGKAKNVMVARVKPADFLKFDEWKFFDGTNWNADMNKVANITDSASNEMSVTPMPDGRYAMVFTIMGMSYDVGMRIGKTPYGPFGKVIKLWNVDTLKNQSDKMFTYNAKAHPALSKPGELIISYNVNAFDFFDVIKTHPNLYRPRFIRLQFLP